MNKNKVINHLRKLSGHDFVEIVDRGNKAIKLSLSVIKTGSKVLIPEEGGWLSYKTIPGKLGLKIDEVKCDNSKINLVDLEKKLISHEYQALLYQNPGGYFAQQPMQDIYELCKEHDCLVIMDVSGGIGTELCNGQYADLIVGSFGKWKLIDVGNGGFISCKNSKLWDKLIFNDKILQKIEGLPKRINELNLSREKILQELIELPIIYPKDVGFVVVIKFNNEREKGKILKYCEKNDLPYTECPRYIRLNDSAISIEVKRL